MHHLRYPHTIGSLFWPSDVPADLQPLYSFLVLARETDKHVSSPLSDYAWQLEPLAAMAEAIAASDPARGEYSFELGFCPVSPLQLGVEVCDGLLAVAQHETVVEILPAPMGGTTAPATLAGGLAQQHAEVLAGIVLAQAVKPGTPCYAGVRYGPSNPRSGESMGGAPEGSLASLGATQLARRDGLACDCYGPLSGSQVLDMQAGLEQGLTLMLSALARPRFMSGCGTMQGTASCLEALVVHDQLFAHALNGLTTRDWDDEALAVEAVRSAVLDGKGLPEPQAHAAPPALRGRATASRLPRRRRRVARVGPDRRGRRGPRGGRRARGARAAGSARRHRGRTLPHHRRDGPRTRLRRVARPAPGDRRGGQGLTTRTTNGGGG